MSIYGTNVTDGSGTTVTMAASTTVEGTSGCEWDTEVSVGDIFKVEGEDAEYFVASITDADTLELTESYGGATGAGKSYVIIRDFTDKFILPLINRGDLDWPDIYSAAMRLIDSNMKQHTKIAVSSSPHTHLVTEEFIAVDTTAAVEIDLVTASDYGSGRILTIQDVTGNAATMNITIDPNAADEISGGGDGVAITISTNYGTARLISDGVDWFTLL